MKNIDKHLILYILSLISIGGFLFFIEKFTINNINTQKQILIKQAQTHFNEQINTRNWAASYDGVYAFAKEGEKPNPYLEDNTLKTIDNRTLIKINPSWMIRQLSETESMNDYHFRITSLNPMNPKNAPTPFEKKALKYFEKTGKLEYYAFNEDNRFQYMGALLITQDCIACHGAQNYEIGKVRGGISVSLDDTEYKQISSSILNRAFYMKIIVTLFILIITILLHKQLKYTERLRDEVENRTKEIKTTQILLQQILDADLSLLVVTDGERMIFTNKTMLDFFELNSFEEFKERYKSISNFFEQTEQQEFLQDQVNGKQWIEYLKHAQPFNELKVVIRKDEEDRYFRPHAKEILIDDQALYLIIFDEITKQYNEMKHLKNEAARDSLTKLFNRGKFNDVLTQEMLLCQTAQTTLSIIFLDIDFFKNINDTFGHDAGDEVLIEVAHIISSCIRENDFVARWGGEEFVITLHNTNKEQAIQLAEKLRKKVEEHTFKGAEKTTISLGVTEYQYNESKESLVKRMDQALYEAKENGRNKVVAH